MILKAFEGPCGRMRIGVHGDSVCLCDWEADGRVETSLRRIGRFLPETDHEDDERLLDEVIEMLRQYFAGERKTFDIPTTLYGTEFQCRVWLALQDVPYGETVAYGDIARSISRPESVRAVAAAIGANPVSILIPCHRIIGADGRLTGYAGGLEAKRYLLLLETRNRETKMALCQNAQSAALLSEFALGHLL